MVPPRLDLRQAGAGFELTIAGQPGMWCIGEYSTDLSDPDGWELLTELVLETQSQQWLDRETGPPNRAKFYRVEVQPQARLGAGSWVAVAVGAPVSESAPRAGLLPVGGFVQTGQPKPRPARAAARSSVE